MVHDSSPSKEEGLSQDTQHTLLPNTAKCGRLILILIQSFQNQRKKESAPAQHKLQRLTEVGSDIAAARTAARGTQHESNPRPAAPAVMLLLTARERVATAGAILHGPAAATEAAVAAAEATPMATPTAIAAAPAASVAETPTTGKAEGTAPAKKKGRPRGGKKLTYGQKQQRRKAKEKEKTGSRGLWKLSVTPLTLVKGEYARPDHDLSDSGG